jgi:hypothetical protein
MAEYTFYEGEAFKIDYSLTYSPNWSDSSKRGLPIPRSALSEVYFWVKTLATDTTAWLKLDDTSPTKIVWLDETNGRFRVLFPSSTEGHTGDRQPFECRVKLTDGSFITVDTGYINILESIVDVG